MDLDLHNKTTLSDLKISFRLTTILTLPPPGLDIGQVLKELQEAHKLTRYEFIVQGLSVTRQDQITEGRPTQEIERSMSPSVSTLHDRLLQSRSKVFFCCKHSISANKLDSNRCKTPRLLAQKNLGQGSFKRFGRCINNRGLGGRINEIYITIREWTD